MVRAKSHGPSARPCRECGARIEDGVTPVAIDSRSSMLVGERRPYDRGASGQAADLALTCMSSSRASVSALLAPW
jgi:hypothetical protein